MEGSKLSNFKIEDQTYKMMKLRGPKLKLNQESITYVFARALTHN